MRLWPLVAPGSRTATRQFPLEMEGPEGGGLGPLSNPEGATSQPMAEFSTPPQPAAASGAQLGPEPIGQPGGPQAHDDGVLQQCALVEPDGPCQPECPLIPPVNFEGPFEMQDGLTHRRFVPVYISHIYNAHHFCVQCRSASNIMWLMSELEAECTGRHLIQGQLNILGMLCAVPSTNSTGTTVWLRAIVHAFDARGQTYVHVFFVDYWYASR